MNSDVNTVNRYECIFPVDNYKYNINSYPTDINKDIL